ncbi:MAG: hypothetical protein QXN71_02375 [Candidatus Aenigmatarchaeota archaeon]
MLKFSKRLKGDYEYVTTPLGIVIFVGAVVALIMFVQANMLNYAADMRIVEKQIEAVDAAHIVKSCLTGMDGTIQASLLKSKEGSQICSPDLCKCNAKTGARVEYLEGGLVKGGPKKGDYYDFNYDESGKYKHRIFVTITDGERNYLASLKVNVYE